MKIKNLIAIAALLLGSTSVFGQINFSDTKFKYQTASPLSTIEPLKCEATITGVNGGASNLTGAVEIPATFQQEFDGQMYTVTVTEIGAAALQGAQLSSLSIPATITKIGEDAFTGCSNLTAVTFASGSKLQVIGANAFSTAHIGTLDLRNCKYLSTVDAQAFVKTGQQNSYITTAYLPTDGALKSFGTCLAGMPKLATTNIADTNIEEVVAQAFDGDASLKSLELPATVKNIETTAFQGSSIATLTINMAGEIDIADEVYGTSNETLTSLTLKGELNGVIEANAFKDVNKLETLNLSGLTLGTNASIEAGAFSSTSDKLTSLSIGDISDNGLGVYTIAGGAFALSKLATLTIGDITAPQAIGAAAFGSALESVTLGDVKAGCSATEPAIEDGAFVFVKNKNITISVGEVRAKNLNPVFGEGAFTLTNDADNADKTVTITIGAVSAMGGNFTAETFKVGDTYKSIAMTFTGDIADKGINDQMFDNASTLKTLTFKGSVGSAGIASGAFAGMGTGNTQDKIKEVVVTFEGKLAKGAVAAGAFKLATPASDYMTVNYTYAGTIVTTDNPFDQKTFTDTYVANQRTVALNVTNTELAQYIRSRQVESTDDIIYNVMLVKVQKGLLVYQKDSGSTSYGRFLFNDTNFPGGVEISRHQNGIDYTLYTTYVEDDDESQVVTINMQPIPSLNGKYIFPADWLATHSAVILVKANNTTASETEMKYTEYTGAETDPNPGFFVPDEDATPKVNHSIQVSDVKWTFQQLTDNHATGVFKDLFSYKDGAIDKTLKDIYFLLNPSNHKGIQCPTWDIVENEVQINKGNYYVVAKHYEGAQAARIVWLDGSEEETTAIKKVETKVFNNGAIYNLAGQRVDASYKGVVIKNGKKFIQK